MPETQDKLKGAAKRAQTSHLKSMKAAGSSIIHGANAGDALIELRDQMKAEKRFKGNWGPFVKDVLKIPYDLAASYMAIAEKRKLWQAEDGSFLASVQEMDCTENVRKFADWCRDGCPPKKSVKEHFEEQRAKRSDPRRDLFPPDKRKQKSVLEKLVREFERAWKGDRRNPGGMLLEASEQLGDEDLVLELILRHIQTLAYSEGVDGLDMIRDVVDEQLEVLTAERDGPIQAEIDAEEDERRRHREIQESLHG